MLLEELLLGLDRVRKCERCSRVLEGGIEFLKAAFLLADADTDSDMDAFAEKPAGLLMMKLGCIGLALLLERVRVRTLVVVE